MRGQVLATPRLDGIPELRRVISLPYGQPLRSLQEVVGGPGVGRDRHATFLEQVDVVVEPCTKYLTLVGQPMQLSIDAHQFHEGREPLLEVNLVPRDVTLDIDECLAQGEVVVTLVPKVRMPIVWQGVTGCHGLQLGDQFCRWNQFDIDRD